MKWSESVNWIGVPEHIRPGIIAYVEHGVPTGDFLYSVFSNDLKHAAMYADLKNFEALGAISKFVTFFAPAECHGSPLRYKVWTEHKGLEEWPGNG